MTSISDTEVVNAPGGLVELGFGTSYGTTVTATSLSSSNTIIISDVTVICDGSPVIIDFSTPITTPAAIAGAFIQMALYRDGSTFLGYAPASVVPSAATDQKPASFQFRDTPTAGVHTYRVVAYRDGGAGTASIGGASAAGWMPNILRVSKILQASQLLVTQSNAPIVTQLPSGNLVDGQRVDLYANNVVYPKRWNSSTSAWNELGAPNIQQGVSNTSQTYSTASTWQNTNLSVSITPSSTTSRIMLNMSAFLSVSAANVLGEWRIIRNGATVVSPNRTGPATGQTINGLIADYNTNRLLNGIPFVTLDSPASTSAQTYTLQVYPNGAITVYLNRWGLDANWGATSSIIAQEIPA